MPFNNITIKSAYSDHPVHFISDEETAINTLPGSPKCALFLFTGHGATLENINMNISTTCVEAINTKAAEIAVDDLSAFVFKSYDASNTEISGVEIIGAKAMAAFLPTEPGYGRSINMDEISIDSVTLTDPITVDWGGAGVAVSMSQGKGSVTIDTAGYEVVSDTAAALTLTGAHTLRNISGYISIQYDNVQPITYIIKRNHAKESLVQGLIAMLVIFSILLILVLAMQLYLCLTKRVRNYSDVPGGGTKVFDNAKKKLTDLQNTRAKKTMNH